MLFSNGEAELGQGVVGGWGIGNAQLKAKKKIFYVMLWCKNNILCQHLQGTALTNALV